MIKEEKRFIDSLAFSNDYTYNLQKASEEFSELALVLQQYILKPQKVDIQEIIDEIGDCTIRLRILKQLFDKDRINWRITDKVISYVDYKDNKKYVGRI